MKKKLKSNILIFILLMILIPQTVMATSLEEAIENIRLSANPYFLSIAQNAVQEQCKKGIEGYWKYYTVKYNPEEFGTAPPEWLTVEFQDRYSLVMERCFLIYQLEHPKYASEYSNNGVFEYLLSEPLLSVYTNSGYRSVFGLNGLEQNVYSGTSSDDMCIDNLNQYNIIQEQLEQRFAGDINDCKIVQLFNSETILYISCDNGDFAVLLSERESNENQPNLKELQVYTIGEFLSIIAEETEMYVSGNCYDTSQMLDIKPTYDTEAEVLQEAGLLQGNENGLDLLKPLTRAEAVTLLVRALGLESETTNYAVSEFADIANDNWAAPYAALAKSRGIANGISDTEFAPDERVTSDQFAAFALRAIGESDFDYTEGTEILIDKGIITEEQADTMDLFTRGDMAKIIYEAKEKGLL